MRLRWAAAAVTALALSSCQQFFTTSWGTPLARDPKDLIAPVTAENVEDQLEAAKNDPAVAAALLDKIADAVKDASAADKPVLQAAAVDAASSASGIGAAVLENSDALIDALNNSGDVLAVVDSALAGLSGAADAGATLLDVIPDPVADKDAFDAFVAAATPDQLAMAAVTLVVGEAVAASAASGGTPMDYLQAIDPAAPDAGAQAVAVALAQAAVDASNAGGGDNSLLATLLSNFNLTGNP